MACPGENILTCLGERLLDKAIKEVRYFRHFETHASEFKQSHEDLCTSLQKLQNDITDAGKRNENQIEIDVQRWIKHTTNLIKENNEISQTQFRSCWPYKKYRQGKRLALRTAIITKEIEKCCKFERVARPDELPGIKYHASADFINFESRRATFEHLVQALKDGKNYMVGLQGMGGTGKTTLAIQVGKQLEESKTFEKVIFIVVSNSPNVNQIRASIARKLGLTLKEGEEAEHSEALWNRISTNEKTILIILDDVWEKLDLREVGIPSGHDNKNCYVLITTRLPKVCEAMKCQPIVPLYTLDEKEALSLFLLHGSSSDHSSSNDLEALAPDFVKKCGKLPIAIITLARTLRGWKVGELKAALGAFENHEPFIGVDEEMVQVYQCLKLSFDQLKDKKAQQLFLLCSIFPEDYEFPLNLIIRLGIGLGVFGEVGEYRTARTQALLAVKNKLIASSLLLKVEDKEYVKMHDLVREVAQWIAKEDIQVIMDSANTLKENKKCVFWRADHCLDQFDGTKIEVLILWVSEKFSLKEPNTFFAGMTKLKILFLHADYVMDVPTSSSSLLKSLDSSLIHTLILDGWELGDISVLGYLKCLVTLEMKKCTIIELPKDMKELKKLRWLGLRECRILKKNPFKVIERCSQLEDLYFVGNHSVEDSKPEDDKIEDEVVVDISPSLLMFSVSCYRFNHYANDYNGLLKCFNLRDIEDLIPEAMFEYLVRRVEVLELGKIGPTGPTTWKSIVQKIIPMVGGGMDNLMKIYFNEGDGFEFLIDNSNGLYSNIKVFSKLIELHLSRVGVKQLYRGAMPPEFLIQLQVLKLYECMELESIFLDENLKLPYLRKLELRDCPMLQPSLFQVSVALSLIRLETLDIESCPKLQSLIAKESLEGNNTNYESLFPRLNFLKIWRCSRLEMIFPLPLDGDHVKLKELCIDNSQDPKCKLGKNRDADNVLKCKKCMPRSPLALKENSTKKYENSNKGAFSWALECCLMSPTKYTDLGVTTATPKRHTISQESSSSRKGIVETFHCTAECLMSHPLSLKNLRQITIKGLSKVKSLFKISIATTMIMLEELKIIDCKELKNIITNEAEDDKHLNCTCIFPQLRELTIFYCNELEFIFPPLSGGLQKLKSIYILRCQKLEYIFGKYKDIGYKLIENENDEPTIHLPALESLSLYYLPNMISIAIKKYQFKCESLQHCVSNEELSLSREGIVETFHSTKECFMSHSLSLKNLRQITLKGLSKVKSLFSVSIATTMIMLEELDIRDCKELKNIITNEEEDDKHLNCTCIFPQLRKLTICVCNELEFIFSYTLSRGLQKLKYICIDRAEKLEYVFGKYKEEEYILNENENDEPLIHLPALESLSLYNLPNIISIAIKKYQFKCESLQHCVSNEEIKRQKHDVTIEGRKGCEIQEIVNDETPLTSTVVFQYFLNFHNLKQIEINNNKKLKTLFSISVWQNLLQLSELKIWDCEELVNVVADDSNDLHPMNSSSIFPKLELLHIWKCNKMEFIFPVFLCATLQKLKSLRINGAAELKYIFGNESAELHIHLPALKTLSLTQVPKISNKILAKEYYVSYSQLQSIDLGDFQEFNGRSFLDLMAHLQGIQLNVKASEDKMKMMKDVQKLTYLILQDSKIEEVIDLEGVEIEGPQVMTLSLVTMWLMNLNELRQICNGSKYIVSLNNLEKLYIIGCKKLRAIFCDSIVKSLPQLNYLEIKDCDEVVEIIEEGDADHLHPLCFPNLKNIDIRRCNSLKCTFSISTTPSTFPMLWKLTIEEAPKLEKVFIRKEDDKENMVAKDVFPMLSYLELSNLPMLVAICEGIDFQDVKDLEVKVCPEYKEIASQLTSTAEQLSLNSNDARAVTHAAETSEDSKLAEITEETPVGVQGKDPIIDSKKHTSEISAAKPHLRTSLHELEDEHKAIKSATKFQQEDRGETNISQRITQIAKPSLPGNFETEDDMIGIQSTDSKQFIGSFINSRNDSTQELKDEQPTCEAISVGQQQDHRDTKIAIAVPHKIKMSSNDDVASMKETHEQGSQEDNAAEQATRGIQSTDSESRKKNRIATEVEKGDRIHDPQQSMAPTLTNSEIFQSTTGTLEQSPQENYSENDAITIVRSTNSDSRKQYARTIENLSGRDTAPNDQETVKDGGRVVPDPTSKLPGPTSSSFQIIQNVELVAEDATEPFVNSKNNSSQSIGNIQKNNTTMKAITDKSFIYSQAEGAQSTMVANLEETVKQGVQKKDSSNEEAVSIQSTNQESTINQPRGSFDMALGKEFAQTSKEARDTDVSMDINTSLHNHSQTSIDGCSSSLVEIGEILELVNLKDGEEALLAKAFELCPQLRLSRAQRTRSIIAFSYRVLIDILVMLATKTPHTITISDKLALKENLGTAKFLGFEKGWIDSVRNRVFGIDMFDVTIVEKEIEMLNAELETSDITLEQLRKEREEIKEHIACVISQFEAIDSKLWGLLEDHDKLMKKLMELKGILSAQDRPFGI